MRTPFLAYRWGVLTELGLYDPHAYPPQSPVAAWAEMPRADRSVVVSVWDNYDGESNTEEDIHRMVDAAVAQIRANHKARTDARDQPQEEQNMSVASGSVSAVGGRRRGAGIQVHLNSGQVIVSDEITPTDALPDAFQHTLDTVQQTMSGGKGLLWFPVSGGGEAMAFINIANVEGVIVVPVEPGLLHPDPTQDSADVDEAALAQEFRDRP